MVQQFDLKDDLSCIDFILSIELLLQDEINQMAKDVKSGNNPLSQYIQAITVATMTAMEAYVTNQDHEDFVDVVLAGVMRFYIMTLIIGQKDEDKLKKLFQDLNITYPVLGMLRDNLFTNVNK